MFSFLPAFILGPLTTLLIILNLLFFAVILFYPVALVKLLIPNKKARGMLTRLLTAIAGVWVAGNNLIYFLMLNVEWDVEGSDDIEFLDWNLILCNHRSWVDILVLQKLFNLKAPYPKFFLKEELRKVPILGLCWWALDYPFMKRYSIQQIRENPSLKGKDLETTRKACDAFKMTPVSIINFLEGTRFTPEKKAKKNSSYEMLLTPKSGGLAIVLKEMHEYLTGVYDVTVYYPGEHTTIWDFFRGKLKKVKVSIQQRPVPEHLKDEKALALNDSQYRKLVQEWINGLWLEKDKKLIKWVSE